MPREGRVLHIFHIIHWICIYLNFKDLHELPVLIPAKLKDSLDIELGRM